MIPLILMAIAAPLTIWFGVLYLRAVYAPHEEEK